MKFHPDVLAAHAEFGGDLPSMHALYDRPDHIARIAALEAHLAELAAENERLGSAIEAMEYSDGDASFWRHIAEKNRAALEATPSAPKVTEAGIDAALLVMYPQGWELSDKIRLEAALKAAMEAGR